MVAPSPGAPGEFLATVTTNNGEDLPFEVTLDNYTRDNWGTAAKCSGVDVTWKEIQLYSIDGRNKLPGFLKYLKERKKSAFGQFLLPDGTSDDDSIKGLFVLPFDQPVSSDQNFCYCKYILNHKLVLKPTQKANMLEEQLPSHQPTANVTSAEADQTNPVVQRRGTVQAGDPPLPMKKTPPSSVAPLKKGLLGNMLGAQRKTAQHLAAVPRSAVQKKEEVSCMSASSSQNAIAKFREEIHQKLFRFQRDASETVLRIPLSIAEITRKLDPADHQAVQMDVLKYIVYEATEEIGEGSKWIAHKEPSEFLDEVTIAVYKGGCAPPEVLEELMKGDLPEELKNQQRALRADQMKAHARKETQVDAKNFEKTLKAGDNNTHLSLAVLNTQKRDRRTIEEIQRDMLYETKRSRLE